MEADSSFLETAIIRIVVCNARYYLSVKRLPVNAGYN